MLHGDTLPHWVEGRTKILLPNAIMPDTHMPRGPAKIGSGGFVNPAMASLSNTICPIATRCSRTWLDWEKEKPLRVLEALGSTVFVLDDGEKEISAQYQNRFKICVNDRNIKAIEQGQNAADSFETEKKIYPYFDEIEGTNKAGITWSTKTQTS